MTESEVETTRERYISCLKPLFLPEDPISNDIINYFASLLRVVGMEDKGWDPFLESRGILEDINSIMQINLPEEHFPDRELTIWRMGLLMYSHIVEMDAPYEVITNLLRFRLRKGYSPNPYYIFLNSGQKQSFKKRGIFPKERIQIIKNLSRETGLLIGEIFEDFYRNDLRNAISHSDYILTEDEFRCRNGAGIDAFRIPLTDLNKIITKSKIFISTFFALETSARKYWGSQKNRAVPYDPIYKGLMEILVDNDDLMCGFKVHWPNNSESMYRRTSEGIEMKNCMLNIKNSTISLFVDLYARQPGAFETVNPTV